MKKHAFLIQTHAHPALLDMIINRLNSDNHWFFIHIDKKSKALFSSDVLLCDNVIVIPPALRRKVNWGSMEQILLTIDLIKMARQTGIKFDYYHLISGQDYPLLTSEQFDAFFEEKSENYLEIDTRNSFSHRYSIYHFNSYFDPRSNNNRCFFALLSAAQSFLNKVVPVRRRFSMPLYKGCNWWSLTDSAIQYILAFIEGNPWYLKRFSYTTCCDEVFFHTILMNSPLVKDVVNNSLRYMEWVDGLSGPRILDEESYGSIIESNCIFMRKVDERISKKLIEKINKNNRII